MTGGDLKLRAKAVDAVIARSARRVGWHRHEFLALTELELVTYLFHWKDG